MIWTIATLLVVALAFRVWMSFERFLDVDELEHLNASWFMSRGETIYGSFFENHPPILHVLLQPVVRSTEDAVEIIVRARGLMLALALACLVPTSMLGRRFAGKAGALLAPLLLVSATYFFNEGLEVRPDVPGCLFFLLSLMLLVRGTRPRTFFWSGVLLALAGFSTPKVIYAGSGAFLAAILWGLSSPDTRSEKSSREAGRATSLFEALRRASAALLGALVVCGIGAGLLAGFGVLEGFVRDVVVTSLRMTIDEVDEMRTILLGDSVEQNPFLWLLGSLGAVLVARPWWLRSRSPDAKTESSGRSDGGRAEWIRGAAIVLASFLTGFGGLFVIRAPLWQYYLTFLPQLALLATIGSIAVISWTRGRGLAQSWLAAILLIAGLFVPPSIKLARFQPMGIEIDILREVLAATEPGDRVFDCWTGLYLTRLPAYRYFFLNADVQRLLDARRMEEDLLRALDDPAVTAVILDDFVLELPTSVQNKIRTDFPNIKDFGILGLVWRDRGGDE